MSRARLIEATGGALLIAFGIAIAIGSFQYRIGDFMEMGPGMFPLIVGISVAFMGVAVAVVGLAGTRENSAAFDVAAFRRQMVVLLLVSLSLLVFGLVIRGLGMFPAIIGLVLIVGLTEREPRPIASAVTALILATVAWLIFSKGLGMNIPAFRWGF